MKHHPNLFSILKTIVLTVASIVFVAQYASARKIYVKKFSDNGWYVDGRKFAYAPGDTFVVNINQNAISYFSFEQIHGTAAKPVVIINEGGQVQITQGIKLVGCTYVKVTGSGSSDQYGFKVQNSPTGNIGIEIRQRSAHIEVERVYVNNLKYGVWVKEDPGCVDSLNYPNWVMDYISLHDLKLTNLGQEGMYLGNTDPNGDRTVYCNGAEVHPKPIRLGNVKVYNCIIDHTNRGGIMLSCADQGSNEIYNNTITNVGYELDPAQGNGIILGGYTHAYVHNNTINHTYSSGIFLLGAGLEQVENNTIDNSGNLNGTIANGMASVMVDTRQTIPTTNTTFYIRNNTVGTNTDVSVRVYNQFNTYNTGNLICNNTPTNGNLQIKVPAGIDWSNCSGTNKVPVVKAGPDQTIILPVNYVSLSGSATDADGLVQTYQWSMVSGPAQPTFSSANAASTKVTNLVAGTYTFRLTATDNSAGKGTDDVIVTVKPALSLSSYTTIPARIQAENYILMYGVQTETTSDAGGGLDVDYIDNADWMEYPVNAPASGKYTINFRIACPNPNGQLQVQKPDGTVLATMTVPKTGTWQTWQTVSTSVDLPSGTQFLKVVNTGGTGFNFNWLEFTSSSVTPTPSTTYINLPAKVEAEQYASMSGVVPESTTDAGGGQDVGNIDNGEYMNYNVNPASTGTYTVSFRVATPHANASFQLKKADGTVLATVKVPNTGGYQTWTTVNATVSLTAGNQTIKIQSTSTDRWNINWFQFATGSTTSTSTSQPLHIEAENYAAMSGVQKETTTDAGGGQDVGYIDNGDYMNYSVSVPTAGTYTVSMRIAALYSGASFQIKKSDGTTLASVTVPKTGGYQTWQTITTTVNLAAGSQTLKLYSTASIHWNINWFELTQGTATTAAQSSSTSTDQTATAVTVYPNPITDKFTLTVTNDITGNMNVQIFDMNGKAVKTFYLQKPNTGTMQTYLSLSGLPTGNYVLNVQMPQWYQAVKIVKQ